MSIIMKGAEVAKAMKEHLIRETEALKEAGVNRGYRTKGVRGSV